MSTTAEAAVPVAPQSPRATIPGRLFSADELARLFNVTTWTIRQWAANGTLPAGRRFARTVRWTEDDLRPLLGDREIADV